jgi:hypothetical protein
MNRPTLAGIAYFGIVFAVAFLLGTIRVLFVAPAIGAFGAVLLETPLVLAASWVACGRLVRGRSAMSGFGARSWMGAVAFLLLIAVETVLGVYGFGRGLAEQAEALAQPAGLLGLAGQILFAIIPLVRRP